MNIAVDRNADRYAVSQGSYTVPAVSYQVFDGDDPLRSRMIMDEVAVGSALHQHAYEVRLPLTAPQGQGARRSVSQESQSRSSWAIVRSSPIVATGS